MSSHIERYIIHHCRGGQSLRWVSVESGTLLADLSVSANVAPAAQLLVLGQDKVAVVAGQTVSVVSTVRKHVARTWMADQVGQHMFLTSVDKSHDGQLVVAGCVAADKNTQVCHDHDSSLLEWVAADFCISTCA